MYNVLGTSSGRIPQQNVLKATVMRQRVLKWKRIGRELLRARLRSMLRTVQPCRRRAQRGSLDLPTHPLA